MLSPYLTKFKFRYKVKLNICRLHKKYARGAQITPKFPAHYVRDTTHAWIYQMLFYLRVNRNFLYNQQMLLSTLFCLYWRLNVTFKKHLEFTNCHHDNNLLYRRRYSTTTKSITLHCHTVYESTECFRSFPRT